MGKIKKWALGVFVGLTLLVTTAFQSDFFEIAKQIDIYTTLFKELNMYYIDAVNPAKLSNKAISSMLESLDPYTRYYDEQGVEDARIAATGEYGGIGVVTRYKNNNLTIRELLKNSPAEKAAGWRGPCRGGCRAGAGISRCGRCAGVHRPRSRP